MGSLIFFLGRGIWTLLKSLVLILFGLWLALKIPSVQQFIAEKTAEFFSHAWQTKVQIGKLQLDLFKKIQIQDLYIEDQQGDTLLWAENLDIGLGEVSLMRQKIEIRRLKLQKAKFNYKRKPQEKDFNLYFILDYFAGDPNKPKSNNSLQIQLDIKRIQLEELDFYYLDGAVGTELQIQIPKALVEGRNMDLLEKYIEADSVYLNQPKIYIKTFKGQAYEGQYQKILVGDSLIQIPNPDKNENKTWQIQTDKFILKQGKFELHNAKRQPSPELDLDFNDLKISQLYIDIRDFNLKQAVFSGDVRQLSAQEARGFILSNLSGLTRLSNKGLRIEELRLITPWTDLGNFLEFQYQTYEDFFDFVNKVDMQVQLRPGRIRLQDVMYFAPALKDLDFFRLNANEVLEIQGQAWGTVNDLHSDRIRLNTLNGASILDGSFDMLNVTKPGQERVNYQFKRLSTRFDDLQRLLSFTKLPTGLARLGRLNFSGSFQGQFRHFKAKGLVETEAGKAQANLELNLYKGIDLANYKGFINLENLDLGRFLADERFGLLSLSTGLSGQGLSLKSVNAQLDSTKIHSFWFEQYNYEKILIDGFFNQSMFQGFVGSDDPNIDLNLRGLVDFSEELPLLDVQGQINFIDFECLKLSQTPFSLHLDSLRISAKGNTIDNLEGLVYLDSLRLGKQHYTYQLDSLRAGILPLSDTLVLVPITRTHRDSVYISQGKRAFIHSDIIQANAWGTFDLINLPLSLRHYTRKHFPNFYQQFFFTASDTLYTTEIDSLRKTEIAQKIILRVEIDSSKHFTELLHPDFHALENFRLRFFFDSEQKAFRLRTRLDTLRWGSIKLQNNRFTGSGKEDLIDFSNQVLEVSLDDSLRLPNLSANLRALGDSLYFGFDVKEIGKIASNIHAGGQIAFNRQSLRLSLDSSNLNFLDRAWTVSGDNYLLFAKDSVAVNHLLLFNDEQSLEVNSLGSRGLRLDVRNLDLAWVYDLVKIPSLDIAGRVQAQIDIKDVLAQKDLSAQIRLEELKINQDDWQSASLKLNSDSLMAPINFEFNHRSPQIDTCWIKGNFIPTFTTKNRRLKNRLELDFELYQAKAHIAEYFLGDLIGRTQGRLTASGHVLAEPRFYRNDPRRSNGMVWDLRGSGLLQRFATDIKVLNIRDSIPIAQIDIRPDGFFIVPNINQKPEAKTVCDPQNLGGVALIDQEGRRGRIAGGISHRNLQDFGLDFFVCLENSLVMNTTEADNSTFYGKIYADGQAHLFGPLDRLRLIIDQGKTRAGSILYLPIGGPQEVGSVQFITFKDKVKERDSLAQANLNKTKNTNSGGLDLLLNIEVTPEATAQIILDAQTGDIITGNGRGNLSISFNRAGELGILGQYEITRGQYFFTYQNLINKPFGVLPGGTITWRGNPYEAELDIQASYMQRSSLYNLVLPYLVDDGSMSLANQKTDVQLRMYLQGELFSPNISFDIAIPQTEPKLRTAVDLALRNIRQDNNELNRQVFALILLKQFLPSDGAGSVNLMSSGANTLSEMLSKQLSMYITDLLTETMLDDLSFINNFQFDLGFNVQDPNQAGLNNNNSEVALGLDNTMFNNRLRVRIGANMDLGNNSVGNVNDANQTNYIGADFIVEYQIDKNGHFKLRAYNRPENTVLGRVIRTGVGISYRQELDFSDKRKAKIFKRQIKRQLRQAARLQKKNPNWQGQMMEN